MGHPIAEIGVRARVETQHRLGDVSGDRVDAGSELGTQVRLEPPSPVRGASSLGIGVREHERHDLEIGALEQAGRHLGAEEPGPPGEQHYVAHAGTPHPVLTGEAPQELTVPSSRGEMRVVTGAEELAHLDGIEQELVDRVGHPVDHVRLVGCEEVPVLDPQFRVERAEPEIVSDGELRHRGRERKHRRVVPRGHEHAEAPQERRHARRIVLSRREHPSPILVPHLGLDRTGDRLVELFHADERDGSVVLLDHVIREARVPAGELGAGALAPGDAEK